MVGSNRNLRICAWTASADCIWEVRTIAVTNFAILKKLYIRIFLKGNWRD